jgi:uncharacterized protein YraI
MKIQTKRIFLRAATTAAAIFTAAIILLPAAASAAPATTSTSSNVRSGPSADTAIVGKLNAGQTVEVGGCRNGWCYITSPTRGFVSANLLRSGAGAAFAPNFNLSFNFPTGSVSIGTGGVSVGIGNPQPAPGPQPGYRPGRPGPGHGGPGYNPGNRYGDVCFYDGPRYTGASFCLDRGQQVARLGNWNNRISSIRNQRGLRVDVCTTQSYSSCRTYSTSASDLGRLGNSISSIRVR